MKSAAETNNTTENILRFPDLLRSDLQCDKIVELRLSNCNLKVLPVVLGSCIKLSFADLSHNVFESIPEPLRCGLNNLEHLDLSHNLITEFNEPLKSVKLKWINLSNNRLRSIPKWLWNQKLTEFSFLDVSGNTKVFSVDDVQCFNDLSVSLRTFVLINTKFNESTSKLLSTMPQLRHLNLGTDECVNSNDFMSFPSDDSFWNNLHTVKLSNVSLLDVSPSIRDMINLVEINLCFNNLTWLPDNFACLPSLEICLLSNNKIIMLPDTFGNLKKLKILHIANNQLCSLPDLSEIFNLEELDVYNNEIDEFPSHLDRLHGLDLALNYLDEINTTCYLRQKEIFRINHNYTKRNNGRKKEIIENFEEHLVDSEDSSENGSDENCIINETKEMELWDLDDECIPEYNDDYWEPSQDDYLKPIRNSQLGQKPVADTPYEEDQFNND